MEALQPVEQQPLAGGKDFDSLLKGIDDDKNRAEGVFHGIYKPIPAAGGPAT